MLSYSFIILYSWNLPVNLYVKLFLPTGQQDVYDKTGNNNTVEVSAKNQSSLPQVSACVLISVGVVLCVSVCVVDRDFASSWKESLLYALL